MTAAGNITSYKFTADYDATLKSSLLAQVWIRDIAVDKNGGAWVVASGSYSDLSNVGGTVWYVNSQGTATKFTGDQLLGAGKLTGNSEIRMAAVDPDGGLWFGTSADGVYYIAAPSPTAPLTISAQYSGSTGSWTNSATWNNIYSLDFAGKTLYAGSSAGLAYRTFNFVNSGNSGSPGGGEQEPVEYDLTINGSGASQIKQFTIQQLKNAAGIKKVTKTYNWLNSYGSKGSEEFEGVYLDNLLEDVVGLTSSAMSITVTASDGYYRNFSLDNQKWGVYWTDIQGNKPMLAWKQNGTKCDLMLVVGQSDTEDINKPNWVSDIETITINAKSTSSGSGSPGSYEGPKNQNGTSGGTGNTVTKTIKAEISAAPSISDGIARTSVPVADVKKALEEISKSKSDDGLVQKAVVEINALSATPASTGAGDKVDKVQVTLSADSINALANGENVTASIKTDLGEIILPPEVLKQLTTAGTQSIAIAIAISGQTTLNDDAKDQIGERPVVDISINQGNQQITTLGGNQIKAGISYDAQSTENKTQLLVYYINAKGESVPVKLSRFDEQNNQMSFGTVHLSLYAVGYNGVTFADIQNHWAKNNIEFLAAREIIRGKAANVFDPDGKVTRAEFVTMLVNSMDGIKTTGSASAGFDDVAGSAWYAGNVNWAVASGIVSGYGNGTFGPSDMITREQMALMADKFLQAMKADLDNVEASFKFNDQDKINNWAAASVIKMQQAGIINGRTDGSFAPQGTSTRAEAATVIKGYIDALLR